MKCVDELSEKDLKGKRVLLRADFNLPINDKGDVIDVFRLKHGWKTIQYLAERGARVIVVTHIGREGDSSEPVARAMKEFGAAVFIPDITGRIAQEATKAMKDGEIALLENVRRDPREVKNDPAFAAELAGLADIYVNDSFAVDHREHSSLVGVPKLLPHYCGFVVRDEVRQIDGARAPQSPSFAMLGGAKFETKAPLIKLLLEKYDHVFVTGALSTDVFKARGLEVGKSLVSKELPGDSVLKHPRMFVGVDVTVECADGQVRVRKAEEIAVDDKIVDIGPDSVKLIAPFIKDAKFILWSGPTGMYENGYIAHTQSIARLIAENNGQKVIGGGDTVAAIAATGVAEEKLGFLSTGGGAMLEYLLKGTLPAVEVLK